jgi:hypothetical protein
MAVSKRDTGAPSVPYFERAEATEKARRKAGTEEPRTSDRVAEATTAGDGATVAEARDGYRSFTSGVGGEAIAPMPAPPLDGNAANNGSTDSTRRTAAPPLRKQESENTKAKMAAKAENDSEE